MDLQGCADSYDDAISTVDDFFDQQDTCYATLMEDVCELQGENYVEK